MPEALATTVDAHGHAHHPALQHHFETLQQQKEASILGMWIFIVQEVMFFGGLLMAYFLYRVWYHEAWVEGSQELDILLGGFNTVVLIGSSLTMALGTVFLIVKVFEYHHKWELGHVPGLNWTMTGPHASQVEIFISLYFALTGLHALHMVIGFVLLSVITWMAHKGRFSPEWYTPVEMAGLYWHFVDIVWIFLFPLLYLVDRTTPHIG